MNKLKKKMIFEADSRALATISEFLFASAGKEQILMTILISAANTYHSSGSN